MEFDIITSAKNDAMKHLVKLRDRRHRDRERLTLLEGYRELTRAVEYGMTLTECFFSPELFLGENEYPLLESLAKSGISVRRLAPGLLEKVSYRDRPEGLLAVAKMRNHDLASMKFVPNGLYMVAETIEKPGNLGSMLRSADAVGADGVIVCEKGTDIYNPNVIRASTGAIFSMPLAECTNEEAMAWLRRHDVATLAATPHTDLKYTDVDLTKATAIVVGAEQTGLTDFWMNGADMKVVIPMLGKIDSLNVSTAATVLLYEAARQRDFRTASNGGTK
ncbi:MAG: RNA methyltransferase [Victivallaceae bacterium]|nr:RNA methyltransferase [Victivallaceae bacterium]